MKIESSAVGMTSDRMYSSIVEKKSATLLTKQGEEVLFEISKDAKSLMEQMKEYEVAAQNNQNSKQQQNLKNKGELIAERQGNVTEKEKVKSKDELQIEIIRNMLKALQRFGNSKNPLQDIDELKSMQQEWKAAGTAEQSVMGQASSSVAIQQPSSGISGVWNKTTVTSSFFSEMEHTAFQAAGMVTTADGREINFGVTVEMSRAFCEKYETLTQETMIFTDPLVINLEGNVGSVTEQKFLFDLDSDGKEENISFAGAGSGFLALDKNNDGKINDGSELFGTQSGDGFADLAKYDEDGNGWIDENDKVFQDLKIWTKDEQGKDKLMDLKEAGVGAMYLGHVSTEFSLNELETNKTNGVVRSTGVYLKENGEVGSMQHIDLAI